jgi:mRNA interferase RelE/StbE
MNAGGCAAIAMCDILAMKTVIILPAAAKMLRRHRADAARLLEKIEAYAANPATLANNVKALSGSRAFRLRVGDYRVIFEETETDIVVTKIGPRGSVYD